MDISVNGQRDGIWNHLEDGPLGVPVGDHVEYRRPAHCGWHHSLARIRDEKREAEEQRAFVTLCFLTVGVI